MQSADVWNEFKELHKRMQERWPHASQLERGMLVWEASEARERAIAHEKSKGSKVGDYAQLVQ